MKRTSLSVITRTLLCTLVCTLLLSFFPTSTSAASTETTPTGIQLDRLEDEIDRFMEKYIGISTPGAAVAVVKDGEIIFSGAYGMADIENQIPVSSETVFEYGSINKLFVWISVMQLVEQGKLDLDVDVRAYLPEEFNRKWQITYPITIRNILNHSGGFGEYPFDLLYTEGATAMGLDEAILDAHPKQFFEPGTASVYSNYATSVAAYVVECISGQEYYRYQAENIFDRIGMTHTAGHPMWLDNIAILETKAQGYAKDAGGRFQTSGDSQILLYPAGAISGTVDDLARFVIALTPGNNPTPLFEEIDTLSSVFSPSYAEGQSGTAHGFFELDGATSPALGHGGNTISFSAQVAFVPEERFGIVMLANTRNEADIVFGLQNLLIGNRVKEPGDASSNMPDAHELEGVFFTLRRAEGTPMEFTGYVANYQVQAIDENRIELTMMMFSGEYTQTAPYVFEVTENAAPILRAMFNKLVFKTENGKPIQILIGKGLDLAVAPAHRSTPLLILSVSVLFLAALFFVVSPFGLIVSAMKRKKRGHTANKAFIRLQTSATLCGTALLLNTVLLLIAIANPTGRYSLVFAHGIVNYVLAVLGAVAIVLGGIYYRKQTTRAPKVWFIISGVLFILLIAVLAFWNMFVVFFR